jgi:ribosome-associated protein
MALLTKKKSKVLSSNKLSKTVIQGMQERKGKDIVCLDLTNVKNAICDYFIICHCDSDKHVTAVADSVIEEADKKHDELPWHKEGYENSEWILLDYSNVIVHIFIKEKRDFYKIEQLWADAKIEKYES